MERPRRTAIANPTFHIYCDESSQHGGSDYMAIGATFCRSDAAALIATEINSFAKDPANPVREFHWAEMGKLQLVPYQKLITAFAQAKDYKLLRYRCLLIHNRQLEPRRYSEGDRDLMLTKLIFGSVYSFASHFGPKTKFVVFLDKRTTKHDPDVMKYTLNNRAKTEFRVTSGPFKSVTFVRSEDSRLIQATDVITGAIAFEKNGRHLVQNASPHKVALWQHLKLSIKLDTLARPTRGYPSLWFNIRDFDFSKTKQPET